MLTQYPLTALALVSALIIYFGLSVNVGRARAKWGVPAPQASGHPEFDKRYRVQMNTLEQLALFVPGVFLCAPVQGDLFTAVLAGIWCLGRIMFALAYYKDPAKRGPGFAMTLLPSLMMIIAGAKGAIIAIL
jgi:glutathione S-transferase